MNLQSNTPSVCQQLNDCQETACFQKLWAIHKVRCVCSYLQLALSCGSASNDSVLRTLSWVLRYGALTVEVPYRIGTWTTQGKTHRYFPLRGANRAWAHAFSAWPADLRPFVPLQLSPLLHLVSCSVPQSTLLRTVLVPDLGPFALAGHLGLLAIPPSSFSHSPLFISLHFHSTPSSPSSTPSTRSVDNLNKDRLVHHRLLLISIESLLAYTVHSFAASNFAVPKSKTHPATSTQRTSCYQVRSPLQTFLLLELLNYAQSKELWLFPGST